MDSNLCTQVWSKTSLSTDMLMAPCLGRCSFVLSNSLRSPWSIKNPPLMIPSQRKSEILNLSFYMKYRTSCTTIKLSLSNMSGHTLATVQEKSQGRKACWTWILEIFIHDRDWKELRGRLKMPRLTLAISTHLCVRFTQTLKRYSCLASFLFNAWFAWWRRKPRW